MSGDTGSQGQDLMEFLDRHLFAQVVNKPTRGGNIHKCAKIRLRGYSEPDTYVRP